jgi:deoxyhypusine synthase
MTFHLQIGHSPDGHTFNQIDHYLIDGRHFSNVIDVMARRGANIDSDHMLIIVIKLRARICRASDTNPQQLRHFAVDRLKDMDVALRYYDELESELQGVQAQPLLDEKCKKLEETIQRVATYTIGYTRKQANKEYGLTRSVQR